MISELIADIEKEETDLGLTLTMNLDLLTDLPDPDATAVSTCSKNLKAVCDKAWEDTKIDGDKDAEEMREDLCGETKDETEEVIKLNCEMLGTLVAIKKDDPLYEEQLKEFEKARDAALKKYGIEATPETTDETTKEGEGEETGAAYISASAAVVVLGAMLQ